MQPANFENVNHSLRSFRNAILWLRLGGLGLVFVGIILIAANSRYSSDFGFVALGGGLIYIGVGLYALGIFGSFLKITAKAIIEGLGGTITETRGQVSGGKLGTEQISQPTPNIGVASGDAQAEDTAPLAANASVELWQMLSGREYKEWDEAGRPDLRSWFDSPTGNFRRWLNENS